MVRISLDFEEPDMGTSHAIFFNFEFFIFFLLILVVVLHLLFFFSSEIMTGIDSVSEANSAHGSAMLYEDSRVVLPETWFTNVHGWYTLAAYLVGWKYCSRWVLWLESKYLGLFYYSTHGPWIWSVYAIWVLSTERVHCLHSSLGHSSFAVISAINLFL